MQVFHLVGSTRKRYAFIGDMVRCAVKVAIPQGMVKKGDIVDVMIVRTKKELRRADGTYIRFSENAGVIIKDGKMLEHVFSVQLLVKFVQQVKQKLFHQLQKYCRDVL